MRSRLLPILIAIVLAIFVLNQANGQIGGFIINGADAIVYSDLADAPTLETLIASVAPRFVVQYANGMKFINIVPIPNAMQFLLGQAEDRFVFQYANANRYYQLNFPIGLVSDTDPPSIQNLSLSMDWIVTWDTDELATGELYWGEQSGAYTQTISDTLYSSSHQLQMVGVSPGATYYYIVKSSDRSHNTSQSAENTFVVDTSITGLKAENNGPTRLGNQTTLSASFTSGTNVIFTWHFGDGTTGNGQIVTHVYPLVSSYTATVIATNSVSTENAVTTVTIFQPSVSHILFIPVIRR